MDMFSFLELGLFGRASAHFRESLHKISIESLLSKKLFGIAPTGLSPEAALGALLNWPDIIESV